MATIDFRELGATGLKKQGGIVQEEYQRELQGPRGIKTIGEMMQDPVIGAILMAVEMLLRRVDWHVKPCGDMENPAVQDAAEFIESCMEDMSSGWEDMLSEILTMLPYGWSYLEIVYKERKGESDDPAKRSRYDDGRIGWRKWSIRSQETLDRWEFDDNGGLSGMWQMQETGASVLVPIEKALLFRTTARKGNPEGRSILRSAYRPYFFKHHIENIEGIGIERDLAGLPVAHVPPEILADTATDGQKALLRQVKEIITNIRRDEQEGVVWPLAYDEGGRELFKLELLSAGGERQFDTDKIIARYDQRIAMSVLADFILLGHEAVGSYALSASKESLFQTALETWLDSIEDVINTHAIPRLLRLNGMDATSAPEFEFGDIATISLTELADFVQRIAGAGMALFPDVEVENAIRAKAGLPALSEDEVQRREEEGANAKMSQPGQATQDGGADILGYHIEQGVVTHNEARAELGLPPVDETTDQKLRELRKLLEVLSIAVAAGYSLAEAAAMVGLPAPQDEPAPAPPRAQQPTQQASANEMAAMLEAAQRILLRGTYGGE